MQDNLVVGDGKITGTLKYIDSGTLAHDWGAGYFMGLKFTNIAQGATSVKVGLSPSVSSGLVEIINDPDKNGAFKVTDKNAQKFIVVTEANGVRSTNRYSLSGLELEEES